VAGIYMRAASKALFGKSVDMKYQSRLLIISIPTRELWLKIRKRVANKEKNISDITTTNQRFFTGTF
jgi:hypothetical protein